MRQISFGALLALGLGLATGPVEAYEIVGIGDFALLGRDATDPQDDGDENCVIAGGSHLACGFDATFASNNEPGFSTHDDGGEKAFNVFDNQFASGDGKWCCDAPAAGTDDPLGSL